MRAEKLLQFWAVCILLPSAYAIQYEWQEREAARSIIDVIGPFGRRDDHEQRERSVTE